MAAAREQKRHAAREEPHERRAGRSAPRAITARHGRHVEAMPVLPPVAEDLPADVPDDHCVKKWSPPVAMPRAGWRAARACA
jgi:hypothetical protein